MNKDGASFNGFVSNLPSGFDIIAVGNGTSSYGIYIKAQGAWLKARLKLTANIIGSSSDIITNPTCVASISESVQTNYSDVWSKVVTEKDRGVGQYVRAGLASAGWYKIYEAGAYNQGQAVRIDLGSFFNNNANGAHIIDLTFGYENAQMSETCRDQHSIFTKLRVCWGSGSDKNAILAYYNRSDSNTCYANIMSTQYADNGEAFNFVSVDASQYAHYKEFNLGTSGLYENGVKVITESNLQVKDIGYVSNSYYDLYGGKILQIGNNCFCTFTITVKQSSPEWVSCGSLPVSVGTDQNIGSYGANGVEMYIRGSVIQCAGGTAGQIECASVWFPAAT
jgi:hypothetical protein